MRVIVSENKIECGTKAAVDGAELLKSAIGQKGAANIILATGASRWEKDGFPLSKTCRNRQSQ